MSQLITESADTYHAKTQYLGSTALKEARKSLRHFKTCLDGKREFSKSTRTAFDLGTSAHEAILEGSMKSFLLGPEVSSKAVKPWKECVDANPDKIVLTPDEFTRVKEMYDAFHTHPTAAPLLNDALIERSAYAQDHHTGLLIKARPDVIIGSTIFDYKTTSMSDLSDRAITNQIVSLGYHISAAHYIATLDALKIRIDRYLLGFQEVKAPYGIRIIELSRAFIDEAMATRFNLMNQIAVAVKTNEFPSYPEIITKLDIPAWAMSADVGVA